MRMQVVRVPVGGGRVRVLNDAYNANPDSMAAALDTLATLSPEAGGRRVAVLADMFELGSASDDLHRAVVRRALADRSGLDRLVLLGERMAAAAVALGQSPDPTGRVVAIADSGDEACRVAAAHIRAGDLVLLKGSRRMRLERVLELFRAAASSVAGAAA
jgi:UDP-N-acetylmuramoyl-tripeptide--D-alanyl-D-alanine ligase